MIRLDPIARVRVTADGAAFNRFSMQVLRIGITPSGPSFYNTATGTHMNLIPRAVIVATARTRVYQQTGAPRTVVRCASDDGVQPAHYIADPIDDLCMICPNRDRDCIVMTPVLIVSRQGSGWRVFRLDLTGDNAERARRWEQLFHIDWDLEREADITIGLDVSRTVELRRGPPKLVPTRHTRELFELWRLLQLLPLPAAMLKEHAR